MNISVRLLTTHLSEFHLALSTQTLFSRKASSIQAEKHLQIVYSAHGFLLLEGKGKQG